MNKTKCVTVGIGLVLGAVAVSTLTGCVHRARHRTVYAPPPHYEEPTVVVHDDYVYYPSHQVYYSGRRNQYIYQEGRSWVSSPAPRVSVDVLFASPSVRLDFRDDPARHHSRVVRQYPRHWRPPGDHHNHGQERWNHGRGNDRGDRR